MKIINASFQILDCPDGNSILKKIEKIGRVCYKSEDRITDESANSFIKNLIKSGHESVLEHESITIKFVCDRGVSHELVRHRLASFTQSSTRYCNYSLGKFGNEITVIKPLFWDEDNPSYHDWVDAMQHSEYIYIRMIQRGDKPEMARSVLANSLATEVVVTANIREWRHILKLRTSIKAHPQMRELMMPLLKKLQRTIPIIFDDIGV